MSAVLIILNFRAPAFVSTGSKTLQEEEEEGLRQADADEPERDEDEDGSESSTSSESDSGSENDDGSSGVPSPRIRDADDYNEEEQTTGGLGLGFRNASRQGITDESTREAGQREEGGATEFAPRRRAGIGATFSAGKKTLPDETTYSVGNEPDARSSTDVVDATDRGSKPTGIPSSFGRPPPSLTAHSGHHTQRRFLPRPQSPVVSSNKAHLTAAEKAHFSKIQSSFGARLLAKQGWEAGKGLGIQEDGRAVPIEVGKVMRGQGIQRGIRTEDSKREARRQGVTFSDDEDEEAPRRRRHREKGPKVHKEKSEEDQGWKRQKKVKVKVQHKTYEQLLAEAGDAVSAPGIGLVLDARGGEVC